MDISYIDLTGSQIESISAASSELRIAFSRAYIIKSMTGSAERTRWWQAGVLILAGVDDQPELPSGPLICSGGDIDENVYTYRDMIPIPFTSRGTIRCTLRFAGRDAPLVVEGRSVRLELDGVPKYLEHLRDRPSPR
jgi:hypothetical protein